LPFAPQASIHDVAAQPTIYDVARLAGVSTSTVSRAFARPGRVHPDTAAKVFIAASELGYRARPLPGLVAAQSRTLALVVTDITNPFYAQIIRGANESAGKLGYRIRISDTQENALVEREWIEQEIATVAGVILASSRMSDSAIRTVAKQRPVVALNRRIPEVPSLLIDNAQGMQRVIEHLSNLGHRSVTYLAGPESSWTDGVRWQALREAGRTFGVRVRRVGPTQKATIEGGFRRVPEIVSMPTTAVIAYNDALAVGIIKGLRRMNFEVPGDVSVVGIDNTLLAQVVEPELTTVASPLRVQGQTAVRQLDAMINGTATTVREPLVMPVSLIERQSTGPCTTDPPRTR
jgi:DNA-binding LacI/PurR family transcriptional regulator